LAAIAGGASTHEEQYLQYNGDGGSFGRISISFQTDQIPSKSTMDACNEI
jgi:hypothetical protein